jgi:excisionase family DNA binding protein
MSTVVTKLVPTAQETSITLHSSEAAPSVTAKPLNNDSAFGPLLTVGEVATILRVHPNRVYELASRKALPAVRVGRLLRFHVDTLYEWIRSGGTQDQTVECAILLPRRGQ